MLTVFLDPYGEVGLESLLDSSEPAGPARRVLSLLEGAVLLDLG